MGRDSDGEYGQGSKDDGSDRYLEGGGAGAPGQAGLHLHALIALVLVGTREPLQHVHVNTVLGLL
jgi:hypothetical protein